MTDMGSEVAQNSEICLLELHKQVDGNVCNHDIRRVLVTQNILTNRDTRRTKVGLHQHLQH